jgi:3-dehydrosphinganine reductase
MKLSSYFAGKNALITGGSSGIGAAVAQRLVGLGADVILIARGEARLAEAAARITAERGDAMVRTLALDITDERAVGKIIPRLLTEHRADLLVNGAGAGHAQRFLETEPARFRAVMEVNYFGTLWMARAVVPHLLERGRGHLVNVASIASLEGVYGYSAYSPSKFAVHGLSQVLRAELKPRGILVSVVLPPNTDTPMLKAELAQMPPEMRPIWESSRVVSATRVAEDLLRGVARGRFEIIPGLDNRLTARLHRLSQTPLRAYFDRRVRRELEAQ